MAGYRKGRINEEMMREVAAILRTVKDPRVSDAFVSITDAEVTADLKYAKIYYSFLSKKYTDKDVKDGLKSANAFIRGKLAHGMNLRITPELSFIPDNSIREGARIDALMKSIGLGGAEKTENGGEKD